MPGRAIVEKVSGLTRRAMQGATVKAAAQKDHGFDRARRICCQQAGKARQELTLGFFVKVMPWRWTPAAAASLSPGSSPAGFRSLC